MSLNPRLIAIQGFELTPVALAVQGFIDYVQKNAGWDTSQGVAGKNPVRNYAAENLNRVHEQRKARDAHAPEDYNLARLHADDQDAAEFIMALVQSEILYGVN